MVNNSIMLKKISSVRHNISRLEGKVCVSLEGLKSDLDVQDIVLHNLQLAIQGCIDIGSHIVSDEGWGVAGSFNEIVYILHEKGVINEKLQENMISMIGFRNILVHEYEEVNLDIVYQILHDRLKDIKEYLMSVVDYFAL